MSEKVSKKQAGLLWARATKEKGMTDDQLGGLLFNVCGADTTYEVPRDDMDKVLSAIEKWQAGGDADSPPQREEAPEPGLKSTGASAGGGVLTVNANNDDSEKWIKKDAVNCATAIHVAQIEMGKEVTMQSLLDKARLIADWLARGGEQPDDPF